MSTPPEKANARLQQGERVKQLANGRRLQACAHDVNITYGPSELCAWRVEPGVFWIQTTEPKFSRKLEKRQDTRRVGITGINHFRRTFEVRGTWRKIRRIIDRYLVSAGDQVSGDLQPQAASKKRGSITIAVRSNRRGKAVFVRGGVR